jgi:hypothetical protein
VLACLTFVLSGNTIIHACRHTLGSTTSADTDFPNASAIVAPMALAARFRRSLSRYASR